MAIDPRLQKHIDIAAAGVAESDREWEEQNWTTVRVQLTPSLGRQFAIKKEDIGQLLYLLEMLSQ